MLSRINKQTVILMIAMTIITKEIGGVIEGEVIEEVY